MSIREKLYQIQQLNNTMLCVGLDATVEKLPHGFGNSLDELLRFNMEIIEATKDYCCAFKINFGFYERYGSAGYRILEKTREAIPSNHISIADAKRGDIGNTADSYAVSILETMNFDSVTVNPYMGKDTVDAFLRYDNKLVFILALTSNPGSADFQYLTIGSKPLYRHVMDTALAWPSHAECAFVVGATHVEELAELRASYADVCFLIPGVGSQGADARSIHRANAGGPAIVNSSRAILYASSADDYAEAAARIARESAAQLCVRSS